MVLTSGPLAWCFFGLGFCPRGGAVVGGRARRLISQTKRFSIGSWRCADEPGLPGGGAGFV